ncbi:hypothetical protein, partial [Nonomuraea cavernae]
PTPTPTPTPPTSVAGIGIGPLTLNDDAVGGATVTIRATGTRPITATAVWSVAGDPVQRRQVRLSGETSYTRTFSHTFAERPCGRTVTLTVTTSPAAPGGARTASLNVPPCPTTVSGLRVGLAMAPSPGTRATARIRVTTTGTDAVPVEAGFALNGDGVGTRKATLSGRTAYTRTLTLPFESRPCGSTVSVSVTAGDRKATARARVTCPPGVKQVSIVRSAVNARGLATAAVAVSTVNDRPVRLTVGFYLAGRLTGTRQVALSGETSYLRVLNHSFGDLPCGVTWQIRAATRPGAANGGDMAAGRTPACPPENEEPDTEQPATERPQTDEPATKEPETPGTIG